MLSIKPINACVLNTCFKEPSLRTWTSFQWHFCAQLFTVNYWLWYTAAFEIIVCILFIREASEYREVLCPNYCKNANSSKSVCQTEDFSSISPKVTFQSNCSEQILVNKHLLRRLRLTVSSTFFLFYPKRVDYINQSHQLLLRRPSNLFLLFLVLSYLFVFLWEFLLRPLICLFFWKISEIGDENQFAKGFLFVLAWFLGPFLSFFFFFALNHVFCIVCFVAWSFLSIVGMRKEFCYSTKFHKNSWSIYYIKYWV